jgi:phthalate 4,5-dioxygenase oxygenase subunit
VLASEALVIEAGRGGRDDAVTRGQRATDPGRPGDADGSHHAPVQKTETFTGIDAVNVQDRAVQESMGPIVDRSREHLGPADKAIIQARRLLLQAVKTVQEGGTPRGINPTYYALRASEGVLPRDANWRERLAPELPVTEILQTV